MTHRRRSEMLLRPMIRIALALTLVALTGCAIPSVAAGRTLTRHDARVGAIDFMDRVAWAFDEAQSGERVHVRPAPYCIRLSRVTVTCPVTLRLPSSRAVLRGWLRVHRTRQGLLGYLLPWDPAAVRETLGKAPALEPVVETVQVGVE